MLSFLVVLCWQQYRGKHPTSQQMEIRLEVVGLQGGQRVRLTCISSERRCVCGGGVIFSMDKLILVMVEKRKAQPLAVSL